MNREKLEEGIRLLHEELRILKSTRFAENKDFVQHGTTSLYQHLSLIHISEPTRRP